MTITEQKAFLQTYTGKAQAPAHPAQDWADAVKELHFEAQTAPVEFANAYGMYERLTITYEGRTVTASTRVASSSSSISTKGVAAETRYSDVSRLL